jgi:hypothetical protein
MSWFSLFGSLLAGRRSPVSSLGDEWVGPLAQLGLPSHTFDDLLANRSLHPHFHYRHFIRPKKGGGSREIVEPDVKLKQLQRWIIDRFLMAERPHHAATAYCKNSSIADHVWPHAGAEVIISADVQDFFPSTGEERVHEWWSERVEEKAARLLTLLTTYQGGLPQGAPTSPDLSNLLNEELDERLLTRAVATGARYTRYCDDMLFSWRGGMEPTSEFETVIRALLHEFGYTLHHEKGWRVHYRDDEPEVTGLVLTRNGRVRLPARFKDRMQNLARSRNPADIQRLAGYLGYEAMVTGRRR